MNKINKAYETVFWTFMVLFAICITLLIWRIATNQGTDELTNEQIMTDVIMCYDGDDEQSQDGNRHNNFKITYPDEVHAIAKIFIQGTGDIMVMNYHNIEGDWQLESHGWAFK